MNRIIILSLFLFACSTKKNSGILPPVNDVHDTTFALTYHLVLSDTAMNSIGFKANAYTPEGGDYSFLLTKFWNRQDFSDTMFFVPSKQFWKGCRVQMSISVNVYHIDTTSNVVMRIYEFPQDTVIGPEDTVIVFHWPADTVKATKSGYFYLQ
jgi:hypothetical protein